MFLKFKYGHFSEKIESSCQKLEFRPYKEVGVAQNHRTSFQKIRQPIF